MAKSNLSHRAKVLKIWFIIISALLVFMFIATMVLTQVRFLYNTINSVTGGEKRYLKEGDPSQYEYYKSDYTNKNEVLTAANTLNERIVEEGIILLENKNNALPLAEGANITVFGRNSIDIVLGGSGSNKGDTNGAMSDVVSALKGAGFNCNTVLHDYYAGLSGYSRPEVSMGTILTGYPVCEATLPYSDKVTSSYKTYSDAAIVVISREGGEGFDLPRTMFWDGSSYRKWDTKNPQPVSGARSVDDHYLQLDANETAMIAEACNNFDKVVIVINSASPIELGFLDDPTHYAYNEKISAALWLGHPGSSGLNALGKVLNGKVNPSGRTVDTFPRNFRNDPSWQNFGNYLENDGNRYLTNGKARGAYFVEYREGIYVGYRYYETMAKEKGESGEAWYDANVVYPFGYGKSYSTFNWTVETPTNLILNKDGKIEIKVNVQNTTLRPGKDVVQLYYSAPYTPDGIEKSDVVLGDFAKTDILENDGVGETVTLSLDVRDMASYDYADKNGNGFKGYELEAGNYEISIRKNAHEVVASYTFTLEEDARYENDDATNTKVENLFDDVSNNIEEYLSRKNAFENMSVLSGASDVSHRDVSNEFLADFTYKYGDKESDPWYASSAPTQSKNTLSYKNATVKIYNLIGVDYEDKLWDELLDQLTVDQLKTLVSTGNYRTVQLENIGKPQTIDSDGPMGFASFMGDDAVYNTCYYASECILAATFNVELAEKFGVMVGNESLIGNENDDGRPYSGWYAPAMNIHRSQFGGRNFEYYSEDSLISGKMATAVVKGANSKGVYTYIKHFALNEQETCRDSNGVATWANEQAMRELYFKPFELAVKEGKATAVMSSFNRIGSTWTGGSYNLLTKLLRDEWGFRGMVITDFNLKDYMNTDQMLRAGGDLNLSPNKGPSSSNSATDVTVLRKAAKNILYTVANSNAMNGNGEGIIWGYSMPTWVVWLIVSTCAIAAICGLMCFFMVREIRKCKNNESQPETQEQNELGSLSTDSEGNFTEQLK